MQEVFLSEGGKTLGMTEKVAYIRLAENGCYTLCEEEQARGFVFDGTVYHLSGRPEMLGTEPSGYVVAVDSGPVLRSTETACHENESLGADASEMIFDLVYRVAMLESGITGTAGNTL